MPATTTLPRAPASAKRQCFSVARHDLAVEHRCLSWQPVQQLRDGRKTLSEVVASSAILSTRRSVL